MPEPPIPPAQYIGTRRPRALSASNLRPTSVSLATMMCNDRQIHPVVSDLHGCREVPSLNVRTTTSYQCATHFASDDPIKSHQLHFLCMVDTRPVIRTYPRIVTRSIELHTRIMERKHELANLPPVRPSCTHPSPTVDTLIYHDNAVVDSAGLCLCRVLAPSRSWGRRPTSRTASAVSRTSGYYAWSPAITPAGIRSDVHSPSTHRPAEGFVCKFVCDML